MEDVGCRAAEGKNAPFVEICRECAENRVRNFSQGIENCVAGGTPDAGCWGVSEGARGELW